MNASDTQQLIEDGHTGLFLSGNGWVQLWAYPLQKDKEWLATFASEQIACSILGGFVNLDAFNADQKLKSAGIEPLRLPPLTERQAEALWVAREHGNALRLKVKHGGRRVFYNLQNKGCLAPPRFSLTALGRTALEHYERHHRKPLNPAIKSA